MSYYIIYILYTKIYTNIYIYTHTNIYKYTQYISIYMIIYGMLPINTSSQSATQPNWGVLTLHRSVLISARFAGASLKKHSRVQLLNPWTPQFCLNVSCHILAVSSFVLLMGSKKFFLRDPVSTMILGFSVLYHLFPSCLQLVAHLSPTCFSLVPLSIPC
jgi:hypothetical protein